MHFVKCVSAKTHFEIGGIMQNESCRVYCRYAHTPRELVKELLFYPQWAGRVVCNPDFYRKLSSC